MCVRACVCTGVRVYLHACAYVCACVFVCLFMGLGIGERVCLHACAYFCACMFVCRDVCCSQRLSGTLVQLSRSRALSLSCIFKCAHVYIDTYTCMCTYIHVWIHILHD